MSPAPRKPVPIDGGPVSDFAHGLRKMAEAAGLSNSQLARLAPMNPGTVSRALGGKQLPSAATVRRLAELCGAEASTWEKSRADVAAEVKAAREMIPAKLKRTWVIHLPGKSSGSRSSNSRKATLIGLSCTILLAIAATLLTLQSMNSAASLYYVSNSPSTFPLSTETSGYTAPGPDGLVYLSGDRFELDLKTKTARTLVVSVAPTSPYIPYLSFDYWALSDAHPKVRSVFGAVGSMTTPLKLHATLRLDATTCGPVHIAVTVGQVTVPATLDKGDSFTLPADLPTISRDTTVTVAIDLGAHPNKCQAMVSWVEASLGRP
ncbi:helix-turn-helix domain-containing protein [Amycolatopsis sp. lyj-23]|uniref:helix-turn-helix domain-containing protein n=1 Tax=Amycolatopsis sp. lyj-23 TaxID=2789283 RepID=UPI00397DA4D9